MEGTSKAARATQRPRFETNMVYSPMINRLSARGRAHRQSHRLLGPHATRRNHRRATRRHAIRRSRRHDTETATVPAASATTVPGAGPMGARCRPAVDTPRHPGKSGPGVAEVTNCRAHSDACEPASHVTAIPPPGPDGGEGQDGRTDKEGEGGRREDD